MRQKLKQLRAAKVLEVDDPEDDGILGLYRAQGGVLSAEQLGELEAAIYQRAMEVKAESLAKCRGSVVESDDEERYLRQQMRGRQ